MDDLAALPIPLAGSVLALLGTALVASADEWHQTFLPNRTGSPWDVLLDCCGAAAVIGMAWLYLRYLPARATGLLSGERWYMRTFRVPYKNKRGHIPDRELPA